MPNTKCKDRKTLKRKEEQEAYKLKINKEAIMLDVTTTFHKNPYEQS